MYVPKYRLEAIETIGRKILQEYDRALLEGPPQAVPIEMIIETKFNLILEYHSLRKNGSILGETIFDDGAAILYDRAEKQYRLIAVKAGTILVDDRLCADRFLGRMRFTCAHELGHWVLHQKLRRWLRSSKCPSRPFKFAWNLVICCKQVWSGPLLQEGLHP